MHTSRGIWLALLAALAWMMVEPVSAQQQQQKPNILVIMGDDIGYWNISAYNRGMMGYRTPRPENRIRLPVETLMADREAASEATAQQNAARDAAIHRCINQAHRQFPGGEDQDIPHSEGYKACMASAGFQP